MIIEPDLKSRVLEVSAKAPNRTALRFWQKRYPDLADRLSDPDSLITDYHYTAADDNEKTLFKRVLSEVYNINQIPVPDDSGFYPR